jgi:hypothetical protein
MFRFEHKECFIEFSCQSQRIVALVQDNFPLHQRSQLHLQQVLACVAA